MTEASVLIERPPQPEQQTILEHFFVTLIGCKGIIIAALFLKSSESSSDILQWNLKPVRQG